MDNETSTTDLQDTSSSAFRFVNAARGFWGGATRRRAWLLTLAVFGILLCNLAVNVGLNRWNRWFFDALERKDGSALTTACLTLGALVLTGAGFAVAMAKAKGNMQLHWRQWVTSQLLERWLSEQRYYKLALSDGAATSPEARIADDVRLATEPVVEFATGFTNAVLSALTFIGILFVVGGSITVGDYTIPGYIAIAALIYAVVVSTITYLVGKPLTAAIDDKNEAEAKFRFGLTRIRENVESIALIRGDKDELRRSRAGFDNIAKRMLEVIRNTCNLTWVLNSNAFLAGTFALLLATPKYLDGEMTLGAVMQIGSAFTAVLSALNWFTENYIAVAQWRASARRVALLDEALDELDFEKRENGGTRLTIAESSDECIVLDYVSLLHRDGKVVVDEANIRIEPGERVLLAGESGTGKSTLVRAVAGLWPWGNGEIQLPKGARVGFVPQRPYMPLGTLREALAYPMAGSEVDDATARIALEQAGLSYMADDLDEEANLDQTLSGGERQRIAFARLLLQKPEVIVMDEATAALDVESETRLLKLLFEKLPKATVLSVGHRPALEALHTRKIVLRREPSGARIDERPSIVAPLWRAILPRRKRPESQSGAAASDASAARKGQSAKVLDQVR